jgi:hypothetical protein
MNVGHNIDFLHFSILSYLLMVKSVFDDLGVIRKHKMGSITFILAVRVHVVEKVVD